MNTMNLATTTLLAASLHGLGLFAVVALALYGLREAVIRFFNP